MKGQSIKNIMTRWWREPYPSLVSPWKVVVVPALIIFLVLYLLQPFGIARIESGKLWVTLGAACISAGVSSGASPPVARSLRVMRRPAS